MPNWGKYAVDKRKIASQSNHPKCFAFDRVSYLITIDKLSSILQKQEFPSTIEKKQEELVKHKISTTVLSPSLEYRHGTIQLSFDINELTNGKHCYCLKPIERPNRKSSCCILVSTKSHNQFQKYDPYLDDGPWVADSGGTHYYNKNYHLWFMMTEKLYITQKCDCKIIHDKLDNSSKAEFVAYFIANSLSYNDISSWKIKKIKDIPDDIKFGFDRLKEYATELDEKSLSYQDNGKILYRNIIKKFCNAYYDSDMQKTREYMSRFKNKEHFIKTFAQVVGKHFNISNWNDLI